MANLKIDTNRIKGELLDWLNCEPSAVAVSTCGNKRNRWAIAIRHNGQDTEYTLRIETLALSRGKQYIVTVDEDNITGTGYRVFCCSAMLAGYQGISDEAVIWSTVCTALKTTADWARR